MRVAVVGHVEWIRFARVEHAPAPGEIVHSTEDWEQAGGGGGVAAIQLALLADEATLFTRSAATSRRHVRAELASAVSSPAGPTATAARGYARRRAGERTMTTGRSPPARARRRCRGTSSRRWTRSSSSPGTSTRSSTRDARAC
jgi:ribokinase